jgi:hypothetical protein
MDRLRPAKAGLIELQVSKACGGSAATATAFALLMSSQASIAATTDPATLLLAQLDGISSYCDEHFPSKEAKVQAFLSGLLSQVPGSQLKQLRSSSDYKSQIRLDVANLAASGSGAGTCSSLAALGSSLSGPSERK